MTEPIKELYRRIRCPHCVWWQFEGESVGMTPCYECNSTGYIYELIETITLEVSDETKPS